MRLLSVCTEDTAFTRRRPIKSIQYYYTISAQILQVFFSSGDLSARGAARGGVGEVTACCDLGGVMCGSDVWGFARCKSVGGAGNACFGEFMRGSDCVLLFLCTEVMFGDLRGESLVEGREMPCFWEFMRGSDCVLLF